MSDLKQASMGPDELIDGYSVKLWSRARRELKREGKKFKGDSLKKRVAQLHNMACPTRELTKKRDGRVGFFKDVERKYGLTRNAYLRMFVGQDSKCAVCRSELVLFSSSAKIRPVVDHCHATGKVRGLVCQACNVRVGRVEFRAEAEAYEAAKKYLLDSR